MSNCIVCNSVIIGNRKGKKYCSIKCKQRAYNARKSGVSISTPISTSTTYSYQEYKLVQEAIKDDYYISFLEYCFIRSSIPVKSDEPNIAEVFKSIMENTYHSDEGSLEIYLIGFENYKKKLFQSSLKKLDFE